MKNKTSGWLVYTFSTVWRQIKESVKLSFGTFAWQRNNIFFGKLLMKTVISSSIPLAVTFRSEPRSKNSTSTWNPWTNVTFATRRCTKPRRKKT